MTVIIASKNRPKKLLRCISSIPLTIPVALHVTTPEDIPHIARPLSISQGDENVVQSFNLLAERVNGDILPICDDVEFDEGFFETLSNYVASNPKYDVFGLHIHNRKHNDDAAIFVRRRFIESRSFLFDPRFEHFFIDYEIGAEAKKRGVFKFCAEAKLQHYHPEISGEYDHTHRHRRMEKWRHDKAVWDSIRGISPAPAAPIPQT